MWKISPLYSLEKININVGTFVWQEQTFVIIFVQYNENKTG
jgi:hypothetical protein